MPSPRFHLTLSGEIHTKSRRTTRWFKRRLRQNLRAALRGFDARVVEQHQDLFIESADQAVAEACTRVFGVHRISRVRTIHAPTLEALTELVTDLSKDRVEGKTFAVRVRRRGSHTWGSTDANVAIGNALLATSAGVNLDNPEVEVAVRVVGDVAHIVDRDWEGPGGVPIGTQEPVLSLLSGGYDSPVASWMMMRRGSPVDFLHFKLDCAQSDHAMVVAHDLWSAWGHGSEPRVWVSDFQPVKEALFAKCDPRLRQVVLKQLMIQAADRLAERIGRAALVTGESVGQVSSQTLRHLAEIDALCNRTVLRPLAGLDKIEIIDRARAIGTESLSARAKEVCDLSEGPVAVAAKRESLDQARALLPEDLVEDALASCEVVSLSAWTPGQPLDAASFAQAS